MKKTFWLISTLLIIGAITLVVHEKMRSQNYGAPPYVEEDTPEPQGFDRFGDLSQWQRPEGPIKIGLQAGHWKTNEMPEEQTRIKESGGGTSGQGIPEWQVVLRIAEETKALLEEKGYVVDILPATVPEDYWADAFVSIHADGNLSPLVHGYKVAAYRRDRSGKAQLLSDTIERVYGETTKLRLDPNISRNMTGYYAFNSRRYKHAIHPMTPGVIVETGFLTNAADARMLINSPQIAAEGIANGLVKFFEEK